MNRINRLENRLEPEEFGPHSRRENASRIEVVRSFDAAGDGRVTMDWHHAKRYCADGSPKDRNDKTDYWYRCNPDGEVTRLCEDRFGIPNTFIWTEDVRLIIAASVRNEIKSYGLNPAVNWLSDRRIIQYCHATASVEGGVA